MKRIVLIVSILIALTQGQAQTTRTYDDLVNKAWGYYQLKDYQQAAKFYSEAFKANGWKGTLNDRYDAACSYALCHIADSAFFHLERIVNKGFYKDYDQLVHDSDLISIHEDPRWNELTAKVKKLHDEAEAKLNKPLAAMLDSVFHTDQDGRVKSNDIEKQFGYNSKEMRALWKEIAFQDSVNQVKVTSILDTYGWPGPEIVGDDGNEALFLVIQHADIAIQEKYLPMMRDAVTRGNAQAGNLALLEDRVALRQGRMQIYGSQIGIDPVTHEKYLSPLEDPDNVDKRRAAVGLQPLSDYLMYFDMKWDPEQYKKMLPEIIEKQKR